MSFTCRHYNHAKYYNCNFLLFFLNCRFQINRKIVHVVLQCVNGFTMLCIIVLHFMCLSKSNTNTNTRKNTYDAKDSQTLNMIQV